jgi:hypothetical protein
MGKITINSYRRIIPPYGHTPGKSRKRGKVYRIKPD